MCRSFKASGMSVAQFSEKSGVGELKVRYWLKKNESRPIDPSFRPVPLVAGSMKAAQSPIKARSSVELRFRRADCTVSVGPEFDEATLVRVVQVLGSRG